jgi:hypothetical protein
MRADNLGAATRQAAIVFGAFLVVLIAVGIALHQPFLALLGQLSVRRLFGYFAFCLLQQVALNSLFTNRLLALFSRRPLAALCAGMIFAALHWPNPVLVPCSFIGGVAMAWSFARHRNILPLAVAQALLGLVLSMVFPIAWHHQMRVGPGYYLPYGFRAQTELRSDRDRRSGPPPDHCA